MYDESTQPITLVISNIRVSDINSNSQQPPPPIRRTALLQPNTGGLLLTVQPLSANKRLNKILGNIFQTYRLSLVVRSLSTWRVLDLYRGQNIRELSRVLSFRNALLVLSKPAQNESISCLGSNPQEQHPRPPPARHTASQSIQEDPDKVQQHAKQRHLPNQ